jgi:ribosomal protein S18 acetylase RimI-like enzyme
VAPCKPYPAHLHDAAARHVIDNAVLSRHSSFDKLLADEDADPIAPADEIVGTGMVSFSPESRNKTFTFNPPPDQPYLTNMAVASAHQRKGIATLLLCTCEAATRHRQPHSTIHLQARKKDNPAVQLYLCASQHLD